MLCCKARVPECRKYADGWAGKSSLLDNGILDQPSSKLLLVSVSISSFLHTPSFEDTEKKRQGMNDGIFPVEDSMLPLQHGEAKSAR